MSLFPSNHQELLQRNQKYAKTHIPQSQFSPEQIASPKMIVSCIDHRVHPEAFLGLKTGVVIVIRNAGGRAHRAVEDIAVLELLTTIKEVLVIHHTYCGMTRITEPRIKAGFARISGQPESDFAHVHLGCFTEQEYASSVKEDVEYLRAHPLLKEVDLVSGAVYDIETGLLTKVEA